MQKFQLLMIKSILENKEALWFLETHYSLELVMLRLHTLYVLGKDKYIIFFLLSGLWFIILDNLQGCSVF